MHSLVVYVKEGLVFAWDSSLENSEYSYLCFQLALFCSVFYFFSINPCPHFCAQFLMLSSSGFLLIRELWSSFLARFLLVFPQIQKECSFFIVQMVIILLLIDTIFMVIKEMFHGRMSVKLIPLLLLLVVNFVSGSRMKLIHISLIINIRSRISKPIWFPTACAAVAHENFFLCFRQQNKSYASKLKFRQGGNYYKRIPEAVHLAYTNKRNLGWVTFGKLLRLFSGKVNLLHLLYSMPQRQGYVHPIKQICVMKTFLITLILMTQISIYLFSLVEIIENII